jgi:hypothetical protein
MRRLGLLLVVAATGACAVADDGATVVPGGSAPVGGTTKPAIRGTRLLPPEGFADRVRVSVAGPVSPGDTATATAWTAAGSTCEIVVNYASGTSEARGLDPATTDEGGTVTWSWLVGINTTPGSWPVDIECVGAEGHRATGRDVLTVRETEPSAPTDSGEGGP